MDKDRRQRLRDACGDRDKVFTAEIVLELLEALDDAEKCIMSWARLKLAEPYRTPKS
jgi:DNA-binding SARP family transcriptional activator